MFSGAEQQQEAIITSFLVNENRRFIPVSVTNINEICELVIEIARVEENVRDTHTLMI